jgi:hypothetical protein
VTNDRCVAAVVVVYISFDIIRQIIKNACHGGAMYTKAPKTTNEHDITVRHDKTKTPTHTADQRGLIPGLSLTQDSILQLQRTIGNTAVMQLLKSHSQQPPAVPPTQRMESEEDEIDMLPDDAIQMAGSLEDEDEIQMKRHHTIENNTGMPDNLKAGLETLSGLDLSDVHVHSNSDKPAQVGALAYTQGSDIYVAPGQEKHLPHEGWHVVQQKRGRVQTTTQVAGMPVNDDLQLENEADTMGERAFTAASSSPAIIQRTKSGQTNKTLQFVKYASSKSEISLGAFEADLNPNTYTILGPTMYGMDAQLTFTPDKSAPDMKTIKFVQAVRHQEPNGKDTTWPGDEARRDKTKTVSGTGVTPGYFIDQKASKFSPREDRPTGKIDPEIPSAYMDQFTNNGAMYHGYKNNSDIKPAVMEDHPSSTAEHIFHAETVVQAETTGGTGIIGRCDWGYETEFIKSSSSWNMKSIDAPKFSSTESNTFKAALNKFNDVYRNPESNLSPENVKKLIADYKLVKSPPEQNDIKQKLRLIRDEIAANADDNKYPGKMLEMILSMMNGINL